MEIDTSNTFGVAVGKEGLIHVQLARLLAVRQPLSRDQALTLAAWIVALADSDAATVAQGSSRFQRILHEVLSH